jgi:phage I-like protein
MSTAASSTQRRSSPPAAPVSRSNNTSGTRPNVVRLTAAEREMADNMGMKPEEYAKNKLALQKEGKLH